MGRQLIVTGYGFFLGKTGDRILLKRKGEKKGEYPTRELEFILITGKGTISTDAISLAVNSGVPIFFTYSSGFPYSSIMPIVSTGSASTRREQILAYYDERGVELAKEFVRGKLVNQSNLLKQAALSRGRTDQQVRSRLESAAEYVLGIADLVSSVKGELRLGVADQLRSMEGRGANVYWEAYSSMIPPRLGFRGRVKRGATDLINSLLNFGYGYLRARVIASIFYAGLDPYAGYLHEDRAGRPSLALDLMEEFRPLVVDRAVLNLVARKKVSGDWLGDDGLTKRALSELLKALDERMNHKLGLSGRKYKISTLIRIQARAIVSHLKGTAKYRAVTGW